jgi:hypothetical protein
VVGFRSPGDYAASQFLPLPRHDQIPFLRAVAATCRRPALLSPTIRSFSSSVHRRRRPVSTTSSTTMSALSVWPPIRPDSSQTATSVRRPSPEEYVASRSSRHALSSLTALCRSHAEHPLNRPVQISRATSPRPGLIRGVNVRPKRPNPSSRRVERPMITPRSHSVQASAPEPVPDSGKQEKIEVPSSLTPPFVRVRQGSSDHKGTGALCLSLQHACPSRFDAQVAHPIRRLPTATWHGSAQPSRKVFPLRLVLHGSGLIYLPCSVVLFPRSLYVLLK